MKKLAAFAALTLLGTGGWLYLSGWLHFAQDTSAQEQGLEEIGRQNFALVVAENVAGLWQSNDDAKFTSEFRGDGVVVDRYEGEGAFEGRWFIFTKDAHPDVPYSLKENVAYLNVTIQNAGSETHSFAVAEVTPEKLVLVYLDGSGTLEFTRVQ